MAVDFGTAIKCLMGSFFLYKWNGKKKRKEKILKRRKKNRSKGPLSSVKKRRK